MGSNRGHSGARRRARQRERCRVLSRQQADFYRVLKVMGLRGYLGRWGDRKVSELFGMVYPKPRVLADPRDDEELAVKAKILQRRLDLVSVAIGTTTVTFNELQLCWMMLARLSGLGTSDPEAVRRLRDLAGAFNGIMEQYHEPLFEEYRAHIRLYLSESSRFDTRIYNARIDPVPLSGERPLTITLGRTPPVRHSFRIAGAWRPAHHCGASVDLASGEVSWVYWDAPLVGMVGAGRLPVFVQDHASRQARDRLGLRPQHLVDHFTWQSLDDPRLNALDDGTYLAEFRVLDRKVGYLLVEPSAGSVLVRTFLLVTMRGTPEGSELARRLGLGNRDVEYLGLDRLATLVRTDLGSAPDICGLLEDCGCGGVLDLARLLRQEGVLEGYAADFRAYLGRSLEWCFGRVRPLALHA